MEGGKDGVRRNAASSLIVQNQRTRLLKKSTCRTDALSYHIWIGRMKRLVSLSVLPGGTDVPLHEPCANGAKCSFGAC